LVQTLMNSDYHGGHVCVPALELATNRAAFDLETSPMLPSHVLVSWQWCGALSGIFAR
jgi:hypothetical protein